MDPLSVLLIASAPKLLKGVTEFLKTSEGKAALKMSGSILKDKNAVDDIKKRTQDTIDDMGDKHYTNDGWKVK